MKPPKGFDQLPFPQTTIRDSFGRERIPHRLEVLARKGQQALISAECLQHIADYIYDLESLLVKHEIIKE